MLYSNASQMPTLYMNIFSLIGTFLSHNASYVGTIHELGKFLLNHYSFNCIFTAMLATLCFFSIVIG